MNHLFDEADRQRVNRAVQHAESGTSAEIVPVVAKSSGRYDRAEDVIGLWCAGLAVAAAWWLFPAPTAEAGAWDSLSPVWQLAAILIAGLLGFILGALLGTKVDGLRRLFAPSVQMADEVNRRAREVFFDSRMHHTLEGSGVLLYVSLFEHIAVVLADQSVLDRLGEPKIEALCAEFTARLHAGSAVDALCETIASVGEQLSSLLPRTADDENELPDALVVID